LVNPILLKETLNHLKDVMFMRLREEPGLVNLRRADPPSQGLRRAERRLSDDREGENRGDQEEH
jgi:hypothetical protein